MARTNSIEESEYKDLIVSKLLAGISYRAISAELELLGVDVSHTALHSYHKNHLGGRVDKQIAQMGEPQEPIDYDDRLKNEDVLKEVYKRQLQIVADRQKRYMNGECRLPSEEFRVLKTLTDIAAATKTALD